MASILLVLTSSPASPGGQRALQLAGSLAGQGHALTLCCLQDSVLLASDRSIGDARAQLEPLLERGARLLVLDEDLAARGLRPCEPAVPFGHAGVSALLAADHDRVIGAL